jgi:hypothetical protein
VLKSFSSGAAVAAATADLTVAVAAAAVAAVESTACVATAESTSAVEAVAETAAAASHVVLLLLDPGRQVWSKAWASLPRRPSSAFHFLSSAR